jgi:hypothetical protein
MGFLYFVETKRGAVSPAERQALGMAYAFEHGADISQSAGPIAGPDGKTGLILTQGVVFPGYDPEFQVWTPAPGKEFYIGRDLRVPITPIDLLRREPVDGHPVEMDDGHLWMVPIVRLLFGGTQLPQRPRMDANGEWVLEPMREYASLFEAAEAVWEVVYEAAQDVITNARECEIATQALAVNYRVSGVELTMLGVFTTATTSAVLMAMIDGPAFKKKLATAKQFADSGLPDDFEATPQPALISPGPPA